MVSSWYALAISTALACAALSLSNGILLTAACTVAFGSQAMATNSRSHQVKCVFSSMVAKAAVMRTSSASTSTSAPQPSAALSSLLKSIAAPISVNSSVCTSSLHSSARDSFSCCVCTAGARLRTAKPKAVAATALPP
eukprot:3429-Heterococcus_DN1.PRE.2